jgi:hypothetical protein
MVAKSDLAGLITEYYERTRVGTSTTRLMELSDAQVDSVASLIETSGKALTTRHRVGGYYGGLGHVDTLTLTEDVLVVGPVIIEEFLSISEIGIDVTTAGTEGNLYTALYADTGSGYPGALIHKSAALAVTTGFKSTTGLTNILLPPGLYWAGALCNQVTTTVATVRSLINNSPYVGETAGANDVDCAGYSMSAQTGEPPATFGSAAAVVGEVPRVLLKVGSK